jgi:hydroxymethylbilane synthase
MPYPSHILIATRESPLALAQAHSVAHQLRGLDDRLPVDLLPMTTRGDQILDRTLSKVGGKGLFIKELEAAIQSGQADCAVHSLKDVSMVLPKGFTLAAILEREDPRDAVVFADASVTDLTQLKTGAIIGTASLRRACGLKRLYPQFEFAPVRGNVGSRLAKLAAGEFDALILATAGLKRLGLAARIGQHLSIEQSLPSPGQGAIAIEVLDKAEALAEFIAELDHAPTAICCEAERAVSRALGGNCSLPLAAYAQWTESGQIHLQAWLCDEDGSHYRAASQVGEPDEAEALGLAVGLQLKNA